MVDPASGTTRAAVCIKDVRRALAVGQDTCYYTLPMLAEIERLRNVENIAKQLAHAIRDGNRPNRNEAEHLLMLEFT